jgi:hypothetical protein
MEFIVDRSINMASSDRKPTIFSTVTDYLFGSADTRTDFDLEVEEWIEEVKYQSQKKARSNKKLRSTIQKDLNFAVKMPIFTGSVLMGSSQKEINVVYDTGSDWLVIPDIDCE